MERACDSIETSPRESSAWVQMYNTWKCMLSSGLERAKGRHPRLDDADADSNISTCPSGYGRGVSDCSTVDDLAFSRYCSEGEDDAWDAGDNFSCDSNSNSPLPEGLTVGEALALQGALLKAFEQPGFQDDLSCVLRELGPDAAQHLGEDRGALCREAVRSELIAYGFEASTEGLVHALQALEALAAECEEVFEGQEAICDSLGLAPPSCRDTAIAF